VTASGARRRAAAVAGLATAVCLAGAVLVPALRSAPVPAQAAATGRAALAPRQTPLCLLCPSLSSLPHPSTPPASPSGTALNLSPGPPAGGPAATPPLAPTPTPTPPADSASPTGADASGSTPTDGSRSSPGAPSAAAEATGGGAGAGGLALAAVLGLVAAGGSALLIARRVR
jgi:hypothetical protein